MRLIIFLIPALLAPAVASFAQDVDPWRFESQREEIAPKSWRDAGVRYLGKETLALAGDGRAHSDGRWVRTVAVDSLTYYRFRAHFHSRNVEETARSILARIHWKDARGVQIGQAEYPAMREDDVDGWRLIEEIYRSPASAASADLELTYRWDPDGEVYFEEAALEQVEPPEPRLVRLGTVHYRPLPTRTARENLDHFAGLIAEAAAQGADIVCLPEGITLAGSGKSYVEVSETVPGPTTAFLGAVAREHRVYIVAGILEREGPVVYNTAVLVGRNGELVGKYRKVSLPREESDGGVTPGHAFPTFETDFGRIGILICWDVTFPEAARRLAFDGAEVILLPIWGGDTNLARARAIENQIYLVTSSYDMESGVFGHEGELVVQATDDDPVVVVEVDLNRKMMWPWIGDLKNRISREAPPQSALRPQR